MTDDSYTHLLLVVDASGSMFDIANDMNGGIANLLSEQAAEPGTLLVDAWTFDGTVRKVTDNTEPNDPRLATLVTAGGSTSLYDAIGTAVGDLGAHLAKLEEAKRPGKVIVVIVTDGQENSSRAFTLDMVRTLIEQQRTQYDWQFVFLGANIDSFAAGAGMGVGRASTMNWEASSAGVAHAMSATSSALRSYRGGVTQSVTYGGHDGEEDEA